MCTAAHGRRSGMCMAAHGRRRGGSAPSAASLPCSLPAPACSKQALQNIPAASPAHSHHGVQALPQHGGGQDEGTEEGGWGCGCKLVGQPHVARQLAADGIVEQEAARRGRGRAGRRGAGLSAGCSEGGSGAALDRLERGEGRCYGVQAALVPPSGEPQLAASRAAQSCPPPPPPPSNTPRPSVRHSLCQQQVVAAGGIDVAGTARQHCGPEAEQGAGDGSRRQVSPAKVRQAGDEAQVNQRAYGCTKRIAFELPLRKVPGGRGQAAGGVGRRVGPHARQRRRRRRALAPPGQPRWRGRPALQTRSTLPITLGCKLGCKLGLGACGTPGQAEGRARSLVNRPQASRSHLSNLSSSKAARACSPAPVARPSSPLALAAAVIALELHAAG